MPVPGPDGTVYPSRAAAARALGCHPKTIKWHIDRFGDLKLVGAFYVPTEWKGKVYPTSASVAKASGRARHTVIHHLNKYGNLDRLGVGRCGNKGNLSKSMPVEVGPMRWPSRKAAGRALGISAASVALWCGPHATPAQRDKRLALAMALSAREERQ